MRFFFVLALWCFSGFLVCKSGHMMDGEMMAGELSDMDMMQDLNDYVVCS